MTRIMGIDLGVNKIAYSVWGGEKDLVEVNHLEVKERTRAITLTRLNHWITGAVMSHVPDHVFIEDTLLGNNTRLSIKLGQTMGAVLSGIGGVQQWNESPNVFLVNVSTWKKEVLGKGNASKEMVRMWVDELGEPYSAQCENNQDRYDAVCIGFYGCLINQRAEALKA